MTEKQLKKADSIVFPIIIVVIAGILLNMIGAVATKKATPNTYIVIAASVLGIILCSIIFKLFKGTPKCGLLMTNIASFVYIIMVLSSSAVFYYMLYAIICVIQMSYLKRKNIMITSTIVIPILVFKVFSLAQG